MNVATRPHADRSAWLKILAVGLGLWVLTVIVTFMTSNINLVPQTYRPT